MSINEPPGSGWLPWIPAFYPQEDSPYRYDLVEVWRAEWPAVCVRDPRGNPYGNADGLYWRPLKKDTPRTQQKNIK